MKTNLTDYFERNNIDYDPIKKRAVFVSLSDQGENRIIGYFISESMYVFLHNVKHGSIPDPGLELRNDGRYLRVNCCRKGSCRFTKGEEAYDLFAGETVMDYNDGNDGFA